MEKMKKNLINTSILFAFLTYSGFLLGEETFSLKKPQEKENTASKPKRLHIENKTKDGAKIIIEASSLEHSIFVLRGEGFKPYESLNFISSSYDETLSHPIQADGKGNVIEMGFMPAVKGKKGGIAYISFLRKGGRIHIECPWGTEAFKKDSVWNKKIISLDKKG